MAKDAAARVRTVKLRKGDGTETAVDLTGADFQTLRRINDGDAEVGHIEKQFRRLKARGLVTHQFATGRDGFPIAKARLTPAGEQALTQQFATA